MGAPGTTEGKWTFTKRGQRIYGGSFGGVNIAQVNVTSQFEANGHQLAAAPDMYAALEKARNTLAGCGMAKIAADICDAALAKARGQ